MFQYDINYVNGRNERKWQYMSNSNDHKLQIIRERIFFLILHHTKIGILEF